MLLFLKVAGQKAVLDLTFFLNSDYIEKKKCRGRACFVLSSKFSLQTKPFSPFSFSFKSYQTTKVIHTSPASALQQKKNVLSVAYFLNQTFRKQPSKNTNTILMQYMNERACEHPHTHNYSPSRSEVTFFQRKMTQSCNYLLPLHFSNQLKKSYISYAVFLRQRSRSGRQSTNSTTTTQSKKSI